MKFSHALILASSLAFFACGDDSSSSSASGEPESSESKAQSSDSDFDCSVTDGVKVVSPKGGETFKLGDTITVVFGSDMDFGGFGIELRFDDGAKKANLLEEAIDGVVDGKTCNEQKVVLSEEFDVEPAADAYIYVYPYSKQAKAGKSGTFEVKE